MSLPVWQATIVNEFGDIIPSPTMTIISEVTGLGLTVYSDVNGTTPLGTNGVFTGGADGFVRFFAPAGRYSIKAENLGAGFERTFRFVPLVGDSAFYEIGTGAGEVPTNGDLGTAAQADIGLLIGNVLGADSINPNGDVWGAGNVEYGTNANGEYWKYPDGLAVVSRTLTGDLGGFVSATLPFTFVGNYRVSGTPTSSTTSTLIGLKVANKTTSTFNYALPTAAGAYTGTVCDVIIIGRWK